MLFVRMCQIAKLKTPRIEHIWETYGTTPVSWRAPSASGGRCVAMAMPIEFYDGVEVKETFERDFQSVGGRSAMTPVMLTLILDLYFRLTPITMAVETPEVKELAQLIKLSPQRWPR